MNNAFVQSTTIHPAQYTLTQTTTLTLPPTHGIIELATHFDWWQQKQHKIDSVTQTHSILNDYILLTYYTECYCVRVKLTFSSGYCDTFYLWDAP